MIGRLRGRRATPPAASSAAARAIGRLEREGPAPLATATPRDASALRIAVVVPSFRRGSGGHTTIANLVRALERRGHHVAIWLDDPGGGSGGPEVFRSFFGPFAAEVHGSLDGFDGADVAVATGWQTVAPTLLLERCGARAYLVQDHEPEFYGASVERLWAERSYRHGLHCITAGSWLAELVAERYDATATPFDLGIDHRVYRGATGARDPDRVLFYARSATPRRAVPLGLLALEELVRRRPGTTIELFGEPTPPAVPFPARHAGVLDAAALAEAYGRAAVGVVLSLTNHSLVAQEMAACGLPAVELDSPSTRAAFDGSGIVLAEPRPRAIADAVAALLDDGEDRERRERQGRAWAAERTWARAAEAVEAGLRTALARVH